MEIRAAALEKSGRLLIPAEWRRQLNLQPGQELILRFEDDRIVILGTRADAVKRVQAKIRQYIPAGRMLSEELLADRRDEAERESEK